MKLVTLVKPDHSALGIQLDAGILDLEEALVRHPDPQVAEDVMALLEGGEQALMHMRRYAEKMHAKAAVHPELLKPLSAYTIGPCVTNPGKIICIGLNYRRHAEETAAPIPSYPILFNKFNNTLAGHGEDIPLPFAVTDQVDYEAELVIVIGKQAKYVSEEEALAHVFGYCCVNDLSARDLQMRTQQWLLGKSLDKFSPLGPYLVTADEVGDPNQLEISCTVNGEVRQSSHTSDMIFSCAEIVSYVSRHMTLHPGDILLTGTPEGVVLGRPASERVYLKDGDEVVIEIEKLGRLANRMIREPEPV